MLLFKLYAFITLASTFVLMLFGINCPLRRLNRVPMKNEKLINLPHISAQVSSSQVGSSIKSVDVVFAFSVRFSIFDHRCMLKYVCEHQSLFLVLVRYTENSIHVVFSFACAR